MNELIKLLQDNKIEYSLDEPMFKHTSFKIGGNAKLFVVPSSLEELQFIVKTCTDNNVRYFVIGNGTNLLVSDEGINACVIYLGSKFSNIEKISENEFFVQTGASLMRLCKCAFENELSGCEFAYGIPGSCGGAAFMNAGAYGGEMKDVIYKCQHIDENGNIGYFSGDDLKFAYRSSIYSNSKYVITGIYVRLKKGESAEIKSKMNDLMSRRKDKQPLEYPSAGSTFKRPEGYYAGALIEECGLKGYQIGGAQVSKKHAGFVINVGNATCDDVLKLCKHCQDVVYSKKNVKLEMEVKVTR